MRAWLREERVVALGADACKQHCWIYDGRPQRDQRGQAVPIFGKFDLGRREGIAQDFLFHGASYDPLRRWSYGQYTSEGRLPQQGLATGERIQLLFAGICGRDAAGDIEIDNGC